MSRCSVSAAVSFGSWWIRCGWLDTVVLRRYFQINSVDGICLTKLDVLDELPEIKVCIAYRQNGKHMINMPFLMSEFNDIEPVYITLPGWQCSTSGVDSFAELPANARAYIAKIEELTGVSVAILSTGAERDDTLILKNPFG